MRSSIRSSSDRAPAFRSALAALLAGLLAAGPVYASGAAPAAPVSKSSARARARALFLQAQKAYDLGKFEEASQLYSSAYELAPLPGFLFNIAQCERLRGRPEEAAFFYRRFLEKAPGASNAALAQELLAQVQGQAEQIRLVRLEQEAMQRAEANAASVPLEGPAVEEEKGPEILQKWWLWTGIGLVAGAAGGATAMYLISR